MSVTTYTITSVDVEGETIALVSKIHESAVSALEHASEMARLHAEIEPYVVSTSAGIRWTWEGLTPAGLRWSDTVRIV